MTRPDTATNVQAAAAAAAAEAAVAADATTAKPEEPVGLCAQAKQLLWRKPAAALYDFLAAFRTCRAYRLQFLRGFIGSLNPFGIFGCERRYFASTALLSQPSRLVDLISCAAASSDYWYEDVFAPHFDFFGW